MVQPVSERLEGQRFCICVKVYLSRAPKARLQMCHGKAVLMSRLEYLQPHRIPGGCKSIKCFVSFSLFLVYAGFRFVPNRFAFAY